MIGEGLSLPDLQLKSLFCTDLSTENIGESLIDQFMRLTEQLGFKIVTLNQEIKKHESIKKLLSAE